MGTQRKSCVIQNMWLEAIFGYSHVTLMYLSVCYSVCVCVCVCVCEWVCVRERERGDR